MKFLSLLLTLTALSTFASAAAPPRKMARRKSLVVARRSDPHRMLKKRVAHFGRGSLHFASLQNQIVARSLSTDSKRRPRQVQKKQQKRKLLRRRVPAVDELVERDANTPTSTAATATASGTAEAKSGRHLVEGVEDDEDDECEEEDEEEDDDDDDCDEADDEDDDSSASSNSTSTATASHAAKSTTTSAAVIKENNIKKPKPSSQSSSQSASQASSQSDASAQSTSQDQGQSSSSSDGSSDGSGDNSTSSASSQSSSGQQTSQTYSGGIATFFYQNGNAGACGNYNQDSATVVALPTATYNNGAYCGKTVLITDTSTGQTATATVADECPSCDNDNCLDMSVGLFTQFASEGQGTFPISWYFTD